ncbi:FMRFamide neuropeptides [Uranotaenia lowii]|uniref:FMRFamide neuropeptides n=1 Tax=Uranotaenia lowii TaxID=190385 RepID=UPI00247A5E20|nr:FMRFamide neuropeptides [Uranotaenia lowii]XP_055610360.1 FMRFamide neuropeptides [Uranotaenia lowii]XP_055610361.1 FMRFamide neuropeptides [Uranotaenia lowii]
MKMYLLLAILIYKCSIHSSCAEYDLASDGSQPEADFSAIGYDLDSGTGDYPNGNGVVFEFRRSVKSDNTEIEARRRSALDKNFMRFGRADGAALQRVSRSNKRNNLMRFGRADRGFMRFGRMPSDVPYSLVHYNDLDGKLAKEDGQEAVGSEEVIFSKRNPNSSEEPAVSESGEQIKPKQVVYYRRDSPKNLMRFGKRNDDDDDDDVGRFFRMQRANLMRFGRSGNNPPRGNLLRFGRASNGNLMRFGRSKGNLMRFGRSDPRFLRLVKMDNNFMRFGRSDKTSKPTNLNGTETVGTSAVIGSGESKTGILETNRIAAEKYDDQSKSPSNTDDDYEINLREEDVLSPYYAVNK